MPPVLRSHTKAAKEKAAKEKDAKEEDAKEKAAKENVAKEEVAKKNVAKEKAAKENVAKDKAQMPPRPAVPAKKKASRKGALTKSKVPQNLDAETISTPFNATKSVRFYEAEDSDAKTNEPVPSAKEISSDVSSVDGELSTYDLTMYEDIDPATGTGQRENKKIPLWASDDDTLNAALFSMALLSDYEDKLSSGFPTPDRSYKLFPDHSNSKEEHN